MERFPTPCSPTIKTGQSLTAMRAIARCICASIGAHCLAETNGFVRRFALGMVVLLAMIGTASTFLS